MPVARAPAVTVAQAEGGGLDGGGGGGGGGSRGAGASVIAGGGGTAAAVGASVAAADGQPRLFCALAAAVAPALNHYVKTHASLPSEELWWSSVLAEADEEAGENGPPVAVTLAPPALAALEQLDTFILLRPFPIDIARRTRIARLMAQSELVCEGAGGGAEGGGRASAALSKAAGVGGGKQPRAGGGHGVAAASAAASGGGGQAGPGGRGGGSSRGGEDDPPGGGGGGRRGVGGSVVCGREGGPPMGRAAAAAAAAAAKGAEGALQAQATQFNDAVASLRAELGIKQAPSTWPRVINDMGEGKPAFLLRVTAAREQSRLLLIAIDTAGNNGLKPGKIKAIRKSVEKEDNNLFSMKC